MAEERCRYAPTPSGPAHPGTLLAGLLAWLDARSRDAHLLLRIEDVDHTRCTPAFAEGLARALAWLGLDWDAVARQSEGRAAHEAALDALAEQGRLYPCDCTRASVRRGGVRAADGGFVYPGTCRDRRLPPGGWREARAALRFRLPDGPLPCRDEGGRTLPANPASSLGDPVLLRRDGAIAYHLAVVVDDARDAITRVVRGHDLAALTAVHLALQQALDLPTPRYRHHLLLLEHEGGKLAKLHGAVGWEALAQAASGPEICGALAYAAGLQPSPEPATPAELLREFDWARVRRQDRIARWNGTRLDFSEPPPA